MALIAGLYYAFRDPRVRFGRIETIPLEGPHAGVSNSACMSDQSAPSPAPEIAHSGDPRTPDGSHSGVPRLLSISDAAAATGLTRKAIERRADRGTLRFVHDERGRRMVPRAELERAGLLDQGAPAVGGGEVVIWRALFERECQAHEQTREQLQSAADIERQRGDEAAARAEQLHAELAAIANAGWFRAIQLRKQARQKL